MDFVSSETLPHMMQLASQRSACTESCELQVRVDASLPRSLMPGGINLTRPLDVAGG